MERQHVEVLADIAQETARKGDTGYVIGFVRGADDSPYAVVRIDEIFSMIPLPYLKAIL